MTQYPAPPGVKVVDEVKDSDQLWKPNSLAEWKEQERTKTFLRVWSAQNEDERALRRKVASWVFITIGLQSLATFALLYLSGFKLIVVDIDLLKFVVGALCAESLGMGFVVAKYLFNEAIRRSLDDIFGKLG